MADGQRLTRRGVLVAAGAAAAAPAAARAARRKGEVDTVNWAIPGDIVALDYAFAYDLTSAPVMTNVTESLLRIAPDGRLQPNLAQSWERVNATTYRYHLRKGVRFHDGTPLTAEDVAFSLSRIQDPKVASYMATFMAASRASRPPAATR